jgi:hypothetical protein
MKEAPLPRIKTLEEFDCARSPHIPHPASAPPAEGGYLECAEPVLLVADSEPAKVILPLACRSLPAVNASECALPTAAAPVNQLVGA